MKKYFISLILLCFLIAFPSIVHSYANIELTASSNSIIIGDSFTVDVFSNGDAISAIDLKLYFDSEKLEYLSGPDNSNYIDNNIIYSWYNESGDSKSNFSLDSFTFRAKSTGSTTISINGTCYDEYGNKLDSVFKSLDIEISDNISTQELNDDSASSESSVETNNSLLQIMRTNQEAIIPNFDKNIFEYYITTEEDINNLEITAIPENKNSKVEVLGNPNFKTGLNTVEIKVTSADNSSSSSYYIYVTKTNDIEKSNTNLETLAVENAILYPDFSPFSTVYSLSVDNSVTDLNILAIPENSNAQVSIENNNELIVGDNYITIRVLAEDGISFKKYEIIAHRRNESEQIEYNEEEQYESRQLSSLLNENNSIDNSEESSDVSIEGTSSSAENVVIWIVAIVLAIIIAFLMFYFIRKKNKSKNNDNAK